MKNNELFLNQMSVEVGVAHSDLILSSRISRGRSPAFPFPHPPAQRCFNLFPETLVAEWVVVGQAFTDVMELRLR